MRESIGFWSFFKFPLLTLTHLGIAFVPCNMSPSRFGRTIRPYAVQCSRRCLTYSSVICDKAVMCDRTVSMRPVELCSMYFPVNSVVLNTYILRLEKEGSLCGQRKA